MAERNFSPELRDFYRDIMALSEQIANYLGEEERMLYEADIRQLAAKYKIDDRMVELNLQTFPRRLAHFDAQTERGLRAPDQERGRA